MGQFTSFNVANARVSDGADPADVAHVTHLARLRRSAVSLLRAASKAVIFSLAWRGRRHPEGSQAFLPMHGNPWLVIVADGGDTPGDIHAFLAAPYQGINFHRGTWHGVLTPLADPGLFAVVDRIGTTPNLEEHWLDQPVLITAPEGAQSCT